MNNTIKQNVLGQAAKNEGEREIERINWKNNNHIQKTVEWKKTTKTNYTIDNRLCTK